MHSAHCTALHITVVHSVLSSRCTALHTTSVHSVLSSWCTALHSAHCTALHTPSVHSVLSSPCTVLHSAAHPIGAQCAQLMVHNVAQCAQLTLHSAAHCSLHGCAHCTAPFPALPAQRSLPSLLSGAFSAPAAAAEPCTHVRVARRCTQNRLHASCGAATASARATHAAACTGRAVSRV